MPTMDIDHKDHALLFQFLLEEYLAVVPEIEAIRSHYSRLETALVRRRPDEEVDRLLSRLLAIMTRLTGNSPNGTGPAYPWISSEGSLGKLKHFAQLFSREIPDAAELQAVVSGAYHDALQARDLLWQQGNGVLALPEASNLFRLINHLIDAIQRVTHLLPPLLQRYRSNENVLYFLLQRCEPRHPIDQEVYVRPLLESLFGSELAKMGEFLKQRYEARGFDRLAQKIDQQVQDLSGASHE